MLSNSGNALTPSSPGSSSLCNAKTERNGCLAQRIIGLPCIEKRKSKQKQKTLPSHPECSITFEHQRDTIKESMWKINPFCLIVSGERRQVTEVQTGLRRDNCQAGEVSESATIELKRKVSTVQWVVGDVLSMNSANTRNPGSHQPLIQSLEKGDVMSLLSEDHIQSTVEAFSSSRGRKE